MNLTELEAVNRILRSADEYPVSSLEETEINDTLIAQQVLHEVLLREEGTGWHLNTVCLELTPDPDDANRIMLPDTVLAVSGFGPDINRNFHWQMSGGLAFLVDMETGSMEFTEGQMVTIRVSKFIPFEELPSQYQFSVVDQAAVEYEDATHGSPSKNQILVQRASRSRAIQRAYDIRHRPHNQFYHGRASGPRFGRFIPRAWG